MLRWVNIINTITRDAKHLTLLLPFRLALYTDMEIPTDRMCRAGRATCSNNNKRERLRRRQHEKSQGVTRLWYYTLGRRSQSQAGRPASEEERYPLIHREGNYIYKTRSFIKFYARDRVPRSFRIRSGFWGGGKGGAGWYPATGGEGKQTTRATSFPPHASNTTGQDSDSVVLFSLYTCLATERERGVL